MGRGIEIRGKGIRVNFRWRGRLQRETLDLKPTPANIKYAERLVQDIKEHIRHGTFDYAEFFPTKGKRRRIRKADPTFKDIAERWLATLTVASSTRRSYEVAMTSFWFPAIGAKPITGIKRSDLLTALASRPWGSMKTRNNYIIPMRGAFDFAMADEIIDRDPSAAIKNAKSQNPEPDPLTLEEVELVLAKLRERYHEQITNYFEFAFFTGLRTSELIALRWDDIDWRRAHAKVHQARVAGELKAETKTHRVRYVELNSRALAALQRQKAHTFMLRAEVFHEPGFDRRWNDDRRQREFYWHPVLRALGMRLRDAYQTRHTFATMNLMAGANPMWVARQLGHSNAKMLWERYSRWIPAADDGREKAKIEAFLGNIPGNNPGNLGNTEGNGRA